MKITTEIILARFKTVEKHIGKNYDYSKFIYTGTNYKGIIICPIHGEFLQTPKAHTHGDGCPDCAHPNKLLSREKVIEDIEKVHGVDTFDLTEFEYTGSKDKSKITCLSCNNVFFQHKRNLVQRKYGCPCCAKSGFNPNLPGILYYLKIEKNGQVGFKIGITNKTLEERFRADLKYITVIWTETFENGQDALTKEQSILKEFGHARWTRKTNGVKMKPLLKAGNTEIFKYDVLSLIGFN
jgi:hypothetical protein